MHDETGATRMLQLTQTYGGCPLAMIVKGIVVSAPMILKTQGGFNSVVIAGNFTEPELEGMITTLREGMSGQSTKTDANPPVAKPKETSSVLELRIAPQRGELGPDAVEEFTKALAEGRSLADSRCLWVPIRPGMNLAPDLVSQTYQGQIWLLVYNETSLIMVPSQGWRLVHVGRSADENARPMLVLRFDETGAAQMVRLTRSHAGQQLAVITGGVVVSAPTIPQRQEGVHCATITGEFTEQALADMTATLRRGIAEPSANNGGDFRPVKLRNGVTVELLGVCEHPSVGKQWWRPDGSRLPERPYDDEDGRAFPNPGEKGYKLAIRFNGLAGKDVGAYAMPSDCQSTNGGSLDQTKQVRRNVLTTRTGANSAWKGPQTYAVSHVGRDSPNRPRSGGLARRSWRTACWH